jgi:hypothetical protein
MSGQATGQAAFQTKTLTGDEAGREFSGGKRGKGTAGTGVQPVPLKRYDCRALLKEGAVNHRVGAGGHRHIDRDVPGNVPLLIHSIHEARNRSRIEQLAAGRIDD